ncbi:MAG TPA: efflux RND transporter permease subunit [Burkholderiales bacterium]|nr:efflux RND transporter permease subunit [Burkholderiales bacterium]
MWIVRLALARPYTFVVVALVIMLMGAVSILRMPKDIFPNIDEPVVTLIWQYQGIPPDAFEKQITIFSEQQINTTVSNIKRIESHTINSKDVIRIYFQPEVRIDQAVSQITATSQTIIRRMPPGQTPPQIVQYDASSVPILQIALGSDTLSEQQLYDQGLWLVRNEVVPVPGATVPLPYGGRPRLVMIDADPVRMHARGITVKDINDALNRQNVNLPTGGTQIGSREYILSINNSPQKIAELGMLPIKAVGGAMVYINDVADVRDGYNEQTSLVRHDGRRSALITVLKSGAASTLDIIREVRQRLANASLPEGLSLSFLFDQSVFVANAMRAVVVEGLMAAGLTGLLILLFLGSWRSTLVVVTSIPLAIMFSIIMLSAFGYSLNLMTLGGLALAVGILVDDATVTIENIHRHMGMGKGLRQSILDGSQQIVVPAFVSMLCICIVFLPVTLLTGAAKYLFTPMALAVVFSILASYGISRTLVPVMSRYLLLENEHGEGGGRGPMARVHAVVERNFERLRSGYLRALGWSLANRVAVFALFGVLLVGSAGAVLFIGWEFFPVVDAGNIRLHVNAPAGTRIDDTGVIFSKVEDEIRRVVEARDLDVVIDNIGIPPSTNLAYSDNVTLSSGDGEILVSLKPDHEVATAEYIRRLRQALPEKFPDCSFYFQPGDMMNQILNFGLPAPIDVKIIGGDYKNYHLAKEIEARMKKVAGAADVHVHQIMNQPALRVEVDRTRASQMGVSQKEIAENYLIASSSSVVVTPNYWNDPQTGRPYQVVVVQPHETALNSIDQVMNIPLPGKGQSPTQTLANVATLKRVDLPAIISHVNTELAFDIYANVQGRDLGAVAADVRKIVDEFIPKAKLQKNNTRIEIFGQAESMYDAFKRMGIGLIAAVLLVYFIMVINFQSWTDPFIIITALPGAFCGIIWMLFLTGTNFSVPSLMGAVMSVGVATANSILMVSFANEMLREGRSPIDAAIEAGSTRLRPVLMTASAMVIGMAPMASGLGEGGEQNAPLGRAVIGGLILATVATLLFVPVVFSILRRGGVPKPRFADQDAAVALDGAHR